MDTPVAPEFLVDRPALTGRLSEALTLPLTLLVAQAGAGKTVLLRQWAAEHPDVAFIWLDLEPSDNDPVRFSERFLAQLRAIRPDDGELGQLSALSAGNLGSPPLNALLPMFASMPQTVIVLDDVHHLSNGRLLGNVCESIGSLPRNVHVILSSRIDPPVAWSALRLRHRMLEIRQDELALTEEQASALLTAMAHRHISVPIVGELHRRTEGWAAGLQLAGITLKHHNNPDEFVAGLRGTDRLIADYLTEEVLDTLHPKSRRLLLKLSVFDTMTAELVDQVLERNDSQALFERLEHESLFFVATDRAHEHFRFHQLFRDLLRHRLRAENPEAQTRLLRRAATFHLTRGELAPGIEYLLRARAWKEALDTIMTLGSDVYERGEADAVIRWITAVPATERENRLDVALCLGILSGMRGDPADTTGILARVALDTRSSAGERAVAYAWMSERVMCDPRPEESIRAAERSLALLDGHPETPMPAVLGLTSAGLTMTLAAASMGEGHFLDKNPGEAEVWLRRALASEGSHYPVLRVRILASLAILSIWRGQCRHAEQLAAEALRIARERNLLAHPVVVDAFVAAAMVAHERSDPTAAASMLQNGTVRASQHTQAGWIIQYVDGMLACALGRFDSALELSSTTRLSAPAPAPVILDRLTALGLSALRRAGRSAEALHRSGEGIPSSPSLCFEKIAASLTLNNQTLARDLLDATPEVFELDGIRGGIQRRMAQAWCAEHEGDHIGALDFVTSALDLAEPEGLTEIFVDAGSAVLGLVGELASSRGGIAESILARQRRLRAVGENHLLVEPLTEREMGILERLVSHSTIAELAAECFVSSNTLKTHQSHIYRKLGVSGRSAAIIRARELGLIAPASSRWSVEVNDRLDFYVETAQEVEQTN